MWDELFRGLGCILVYFLVCALVAVVIRVTTKIPDEAFRKLLHYILLGSLLVWVNVYTHWWLAASACTGFVILVYPILAFMDRKKGFLEFATERKQGEMKNSLAQVFFVFAVVIGVCWGIFDDKMLVLASVYAWGFGDAVAALIGKKFGKHKVNHKAVGGKKSYEGSAAMFLTAFITVLAILVLRGGLNWPAYLLFSYITATVSCVAELFSKDGHDTMICPLSCMVTLLALMFVFGGL